MLVDKDINISEIMVDEEELRQVLNLLRSIKELSDSCRNGSITVSVNGDWGTGKTSYLRTLESFYRDYCGYPTVFFEAWKHQSDENYLFSLILEIESIPFYKRHAKLKETLKSVRKILWSATFGITDIVLRNLNYSLQDVEKIMELVESKSFIYQSYYRETFKLFQETIEKIARAKVSKKHKNKELEEKWKEIERTNPEIERLKPETRKLVLIIDDLDRLIPENAFKIIEALRFYFDVNNVIIIMGINDKVLEGYVKKVYHLNDEGISEKFLEKIFHHSFYLSTSRINNIHLRNFLNENGELNDKGEKLKNIFEEIDLTLTHRTWIKIINKIIEEHEDSEKFPDIKTVFQVILLQLFPNFEYLNRRYPEKIKVEKLAEVVAGEAEENTLSFEEDKALDILRKDTTFLRFPEEALKKILGACLTLIKPSSKVEEL